MSGTIDAFPAFAERVRARLEAGRVYEAATPAVRRPNVDLIREIQEEIEDICGWSCALWARLEGLKARAAVVDVAPGPREPLRYETTAIEPSSLPQNVREWLYSTGSRIPGSKKET